MMTWLPGIFCTCSQRSVFAASFVVSSSFCRLLRPTQIPKPSEDTNRIGRLGGSFICFFRSVWRRYPPETSSARISCRSRTDSARVSASSTLAKYASSCSPRAICSVRTFSAVLAFW